MEESFSIEALTYEIEVLAVLTGLVYVILAAYEHLLCWVFGIISSILSVYLFYTGQLYAESILYFYYILAGGYGWYTWSLRARQVKRVGLENEDLDVEVLQIHTWSRGEHLRAIILGILLSLLLAWGLSFTDAKLPLIDAFTTIFSFIATYMVTRKVLENWLYWIVIDLVTMGMYFHRTYYLYGGLMIIYTIIAGLGYLKWKKGSTKRPQLHEVAEAEDSRI